MKYYFHFNFIFPLLANFRISCIIVDRCVYRPKLAVSAFYRPSGQTADIGRLLQEETYDFSMSEY